VSRKPARHIGMGEDEAGVIQAARGAAISPSLPLLETRNDVGQHYLQQRSLTILHYGAVDEETNFGSNIKILHTVAAAGCGIGTLTNARDPCGAEAAELVPFLLPFVLVVAPGLEFMHVSGNGATQHKDCPAQCPQARALGRNPQGQNV
jgi:hypothetical protein